jgi:hypothetical protein
MALQDVQVAKPVMFSGDWFLRYFGICIRPVRSQQAQFTVSNMPSEFSVIGSNTELTLEEERKVYDLIEACKLIAKRKDA